MCFWWPLEVVWFFNASWGHLPLVFFAPQLYYPKCMLTPGLKGVIVNFCKSLLVKSHCQHCNGDEIRRGFTIPWSCLFVTQQTKELLAFILCGMCKETPTHSLLLAVKIFCSKYILVLQPFVGKIFSAVGDHLIQTFLQLEESKWEEKTAFSGRIKGQLLFSIWCTKTTATNVNSRGEIYSFYHNKKWWEGNICLCGYTVNIFCYNNQGTGLSLLGL